MITFTVYGRPAPAGSKRGFAIAGKDGKTHVVISDANPMARPWKSEVKAAARQEYVGELLRCPVRVSLAFMQPRPKGHYGTGKNADKLKSSAADFPTGKPDLLKLARGIEDALTGVIWHDDSQIVTELLIKGWATDGQGYSTTIIITPIGGVQ